MHAPVSYTHLQIYSPPLLQLYMATECACACVDSNSPVDVEVLREEVEAFSVTKSKKCRNNARNSVHRISHAWCINIP